MKSRSCAQRSAASRTGATLRGTGKPLSVRPVRKSCNGCASKACITSEDGGMTSTGGLRVGILIIGSLLWDLTKYDRGRWQHERLDIAAKQRVKAPIRYGRCSSGGERQGQYTMTLSRSAGLGIAYAVPCKKVVSTVADLEAEVRALAVAEGLVDYYGASRWKTFGAIGVGFREPTGDRVARLAEQWGQSFGFRCNLQTTLWETFNQLEEAPPLGHDGL